MLPKCILLCFVQEHLCGFEERGFFPADVFAEQFPQGGERLPAVVTVSRITHPDNQRLDGKVIARSALNPFIGQVDVANQAREEAFALGPEVGQEARRPEPDQVSIEGVHLRVAGRGQLTANPPCHHKAVMVIPREADQGRRSPHGYGPRLTA